MLSKIISCSFIVTTLFFLLSAPCMADAVDVYGDCYFFADGDLKVFSLTSEAEIAIFSEDDGVSNATDVLVVNGNAIVTTDDGGTKGVVVIDITTLSDCSCAGDNGNEDRYLARYSQGVDVNSLEIPGVESGGVIYNVVMEQRGSSSNWEVKFIEELTDAATE